MAYSYYIIQDVSLDRDKIPQKIIAKYDGKRFLAAIPIPKFVKIDNTLFQKKPKIPKNDVEFTYTRQDLNKNGTKEVIVSIFHKNKLIVSLPANLDKLEKKAGGTDAKKKPAQSSNQNILIVKNQTGFFQSIINSIGTGFGLKVGFSIFDAISDALSNAFNE